MNLTGTSDLVRITTTSTADIEVQASWVDQTTAAFTPGRTNTISTTATTTTVVGSPAASTQRAVTGLKIRNDHASTSCRVTVLHTDGSTSVDLWSGILLAGESVVYDGNRVWRRYDASGYEVTATVVIKGASTVEIDLGSTPVFEGSFTITDGTITTTSKVFCWQAPGPYTNKGTSADEAALDPIHVICAAPAAGSCVVYWETPPIILAIPIYKEGTLTANALARPEWAQLSPLFSYERRGRVIGNIKFSYIVFN